MTTKEKIEYQEMLDSFRQDKLNAIAIAKMHRCENETPYRELSILLNERQAAVLSAVIAKLETFQCHCK